MWIIHIDMSVLGLYIPFFFFTNTDAKLKRLGDDCLIKTSVFGQGKIWWY